MKPGPCFKRWSRANYGVFASLRRPVTIGVLSVGMSSILSLATGEAQAAEVDTMAYSKVLEIDEVAIVGTKANPTRSTMSSTVLFDRTAVAAAPLHTLESALRLAPSIDLRERGARGVQADILIRGGSFDQTMILLNGINFTDARTGHQSHLAARRPGLHRRGRADRRRDGRRRLCRCRECPHDACGRPLPAFRGNGRRRQLCLRQFCPEAGRPVA